MIVFICIDVITLLQKLVEALQKLGVGSWKVISAYMETHNAKQYRNRYSSLCKTHLFFSVL